MNGAFTIWKKELIDSIRDKRTLITAVLLPVVLMPVILIGTFKLQEYQVKQSLEKPVLLAINHQDAAPELVSFLKEQPHVTLVDSQNFKTDLENGVIQTYIEVPQDFQQLFAAEQPIPIQVIQKSSKLDSQTATPKVIAFLQQFNNTIGAERLVASGVNPQMLSAVVPTPQDIATAQERGGFFLGLLLPMFVVIFALMGGMYIAIDVSAGEKERKTLEALLLSPASRLTIVVGKFLAVATTASITVMLSLFSMYAAFKFYPLDLGVGELALDLSLPAIAIMLGIGIILAIMFAGLLLSVAIFAKSYKEAQNYITPFYLIAVLPIAIFAQIPGLNPSAFMFVIPGVNAVFVIKEVMVSVFNSTHILLTIGSLFVYAAIAIFVASKIYSKEGILFRD